MRTETVRVSDAYAVSGKSVREVLKQLDPTNIKILSTMAKVGPRNLQEVARLTGIPCSTIHHRISQIESKSERVAQLVPKVAGLGMVRVVVLVAAKPGLEDVVTQALRIPNYWRSLERCEGAFTHHSIQIIPTQFLKQFKEYLSNMRAMNLIKSYRMIETGDSYQLFPDFTNYSSSSGAWIFDWEGWLREAMTGDPVERVRDPKCRRVDVEKIDLQIICALEQNARATLTDVAEKYNVSEHTVRYHFDRTLVPAGLVESFDFSVWPYPVEISAYHEFMLEFPDPAAMNRFFSLAKKLFFIGHLAKALRKNTLLVRTRIIESQVENMRSFFSEMANGGQLISYSAVRLNTNSRIMQTISYELFDNESGWSWDVYKLLLELNKL